MDKVIQGNCVDVMATFPDNYIDLTVTSPPYDNLRDYNGYDFDFEGIANQLYRVTKQGGVVVWVVGDSTIKGSETGTSFRQALYFKEIGFNLHDTMIWHKKTPPSVDIIHGRYYQYFEFMFVLAKSKPKTANLLREVKKYQDNRILKGGQRTRNNKSTDYKPSGNNDKIKGNVWEYAVGGGHITKDKIAYQHPAIFPEQLANDHIITWCNEGDLVLDPMCGSGTTCKMAMVNNRNYIGIDISEEYCEIARKRVAEHEQQQTLFAEKNL